VRRYGKEFDILGADCRDKKNTRRDDIKLMQSVVFVSALSALV